MIPPLSNAQHPERLVIGIDLAAGRGVTALAALSLLPSTDAGALTSLRLARQSYPPDDDAILVECARLAPVVIGLDAPLSLPAPVAAALCGRTLASDSIGASPYTRAAERDPIWSQLGVRPFPVSFLAGLTFRAIPLAARLRDQSPDCQIIEVFPSATLALLALRPPTPRGQPHQRKSTPSVRQTTQHALAPFIAGLEEVAPDHPPLDTDMLDALGAALTAAAAALGAALAIGDPDEGCISLPALSARQLFARGVE